MATRLEKRLAFALGVTTATTLLLANSAMGWRGYARRLKTDNIKLLGNTIEVLNCVDLSDVPDGVITDVKFRAMAMIAEYDLEEETDDDQDDD